MISTVNPRVAREPNGLLAQGTTVARASRARSGRPTEADLAGGGPRDSGHLTRCRHREGVTAARSTSGRNREVPSSCTSRRGETRGRAMRAMGPAKPFRNGRSGSSNIPVRSRHEGNREVPATRPRAAAESSAVGSVAASSRGPGEKRPTSARRRRLPRVLEGRGLPELRPQGSPKVEPKAEQWHEPTTRCRAPSPRLARKPTVDVQRRPRHGSAAARRCRGG